MVYIYDQVKISFINRHFKDTISWISKVCTVYFLQKIHCWCSEKISWEECSGEERVFIVLRWRHLTSFWLIGPLHLMCQEHQKSLFFKLAETLSAIVWRSLLTVVGSLANFPLRCGVQLLVGCCHYSCSTFVMTGW